MTRKAKICFINSKGYALYQNLCNVPYGGAEIQLYLISMELAKKNNFEIYVITGNYKIKNKRVEYYKRIKLYITQPLENKFLNYILRPWRLFFTLLKINPDYIIQRGVEFNSFLCTLFCKLFRKKFIFSIAHNREVTGEIKNRLFSTLFKFVLFKANFIIAQSNDQIIKLEKWKKRKFFNIQVIKSGYDIKNKRKKDNGHILWVARAKEWKRPELFIKLAPFFPKEKFLMICKKSINLTYWDTIFGKTLTIPNLKLIEFIPFNKIDNIFHEAKIFINSSKSEGFPNTFLQAFKNKVPVISLSVDPDHILTKNKIGFSCNDDFDKMKKYLKQLLENHELYNIYSKNAFNYVKKNHDIKKISFHWSQLMRKISKIS